jgi:hypothetical protein
VVCHTRAVTWGARHETLETRTHGCDFYIPGQARKNFIEREFDDVAVITAYATRLAAAEHLFENVTHVRSLRHLWTLAKLVVPGTFIGVGEYFVRLINFFEFFGIAGLFVRVVFHGQLTVGAFDIFDGCISLDTQDLVMIGRHIYSGERTFM